jgi:hypothetical protein
MAHDLLLSVHVAGLAAVVLGPVAIWAERRPRYRSSSGSAYCWSVFVVALSALALVALDVAALWWLAPYIALATALLVVATAGPAMVLAWVAPTLVGLPLIERRVKRLSASTATRGRTE